ncbi:MAG: hypothetical protein ACYC99_17830 [Candidatus Geothermincolia bacterium]
MGIIKKSLKGIAALVAVSAGLTAINIIQAGQRSPDGRSIADILGKDPAQATFDDIEKLSRADKMQLFYAANAPAFGSMKGEYQGRLLSGGVLGGSTAYFTDHMFPTGTLTLRTRWLGKAFNPESEDAGWGINVFTGKDEEGDQEVFYTRKMRTYLGPTTIGKDGKDSFHLDYGAFNTDLIKTMHDEVRQINENLFICAGYMAMSGGPLNPGPFTLIGPPEEFPGA